ncbi:sensor histidine kinase [Meiothermus rufus]|uniref:sensor histidine kinase n=1 Tax=Meiothermus rufus TaxID=604332 RepID=UPI00041EB751|nr:HAMP domain-containing sensor histidine kinase [Meiothermus rufus]
MPIRLRLALWYGTLCTVLIGLVSFLGFAAYTRGQYQTLDQVLVLSANHVAAGWREAGTSYVLEADISELQVAFRLYDSYGHFKRGSRLAPPFEPIQPQKVLEQNLSVYADPVAQFLRLPWTHSQGAFLLLPGQDGQRWRVYVTPLVKGQETLGYLEALTPLGLLDASVRRLAALLLVVGLVSMLAVFGLGLILAGGALRPMAHLIETAQQIARSADLSMRVPPMAARDELGRLSRTFNQMLENLAKASEAQKRFVADASHELRAPLAAIQGNLELLRRYPQMPEADRQVALGEAEREALRLSRLVADLLLLAKGDAGLPLRPTRVRLDEVVEEALRDADWRVEGHRLEAQLQPVWVRGDRDYLKQLVLNLLENALKYTPAGGWVRLELKQQGDRVLFQVQDSGIGIAPEDLPFVFDRFYRADKARRRDPGGSGLGLSIARWIVEQHRGSIQIQSQPAQGTTVRVVLPAEEAADG